MKKVSLFALALLIVTGLYAQQSPAAPKKKEKIDLSGRANDHLLIQLGYAGWGGQPDTISSAGFSKNFNIYLMLDFPFKSNPKMSVAIGPGFSSEHMKFSKTFIDIKGTTAKLRFIDQSDTNHYKRNTLATTYFELPVELRFSSDPLHSGRGWKLALGARVGTMLNAHTRYKELQNSNGALINAYTLKESSKRYFNTTRFSVTGRIGWGHLTAYGSYQVTTLFKTGVAAEVHPYAIGLTLSGL